MVELMSYGDAIRNAIYDVMKADSSIVFMGEDICYNLYAYSYGLVDEFGEQRVIDVPLSEAAVTGTAIGAAMRGIPVILDLTVSNFLYVAMDQLVSMAAKTIYQYNGQFKMPLTIIVSSAYGVGAGAQHSDRPHPMLMNVPGLKVIAPSNNQDMYDMLCASVSCESPVVCFVDKSRFYVKEQVFRGDAFFDWKAKVRKEGTHITAIGIQDCVNLMLELANEYEEKGISLEVIDVRSLVPFDKDTILQSVKKTGRVLIADTANRTCSAAANISSIISEECFEYLKAPILIAATDDFPLPFSHVLENEIVISKMKIKKRLNDLLHYNEE